MSGETSAGVVTQPAAAVQKLPPLLMLAHLSRQQRLGTHWPALGSQQVPLGMVAAVATQPGVLLLLQLWLNLARAAVCPQVASKHPADVVLLLALLQLC